MGITIFLGAGAALEIGGPSTQALTQIVRKHKQSFLNREVYAIDKIGEILDEYYSPHISTFEDIYYALEMLSGYSYAWSGPGNIAYRPPFASLIKPKYSPLLFPINEELTEQNLPQYEEDERIIINIAKRNLLSTIGDSINTYDTAFNQNGNNWYIKFWENISQKTKCDIATLNYDTTIEQSIDNYNDGYENTGDTFERFNPRLLKFNTKHTILHMHGCILYGHSNLKTNINKYAYEDNWHDIYKFDNYGNASQTWSGRSENRAQSNEEVSIGPILTGLRKTDKAVVYPYSTYLSKLQDALIENNSLLIIGYSFSDLHLNRLLDRIVRLHGNERKVIVISYFDFENEFWYPRFGAIKWPKSHEESMFYNKIFRDTYPIEQGRYSNVKNGEPLSSKDGRARIYLKGFKHAVENHMDDIINFLTT